MSSDARISDITLSEMTIIRSVLHTAGYGADVLAEGQRKFSPATRLLMRMVLAGEASPHALALQLDRSFGIPVKYRVLYASTLPRYAIQGLPRLAGLILRPIRRSFRSNESDLLAWENEGGAPVAISRQKVVH